MKGHRVAEALEAVVTDALGRDFNLRRATPNGSSRQ
jgi:hypothetical protein